MKIRGITLDRANEGLLNYETMRQMVLDQRDGPKVTLNYETIVRDGKFGINGVDMAKIYRPIFRKGWIDASLQIFPYGYVRAKEAVHTVISYVHNFFAR